MKLVVLNFSYGTNPYLRTTEIALGVNEELKRCGQERLGIILPWIYGERQKNILLEEFGRYGHASEIYLDLELGEILQSVLYGNGTYANSLDTWISRFESKSQEARVHLSGKVRVQDLKGNASILEGNDIVLELARSPRLIFHTSPSINVTFGHTSEILKRTIELPPGTCDIDKKQMEEALVIAETIERYQTFHIMAQPGPFYPERARVANEWYSPPHVRVQEHNTDNIEEGIYITETGIPGLRHLYSGVQAWNTTIYSNSTLITKSSVRASPHIVSHPNILFHYARCGWGSIWLSQICNTPIVTPPHDPSDDPEIYFNIATVARLKLGIVHTDQTFEEIISETKMLREEIDNQNSTLLEEFETLDGIQYSARIIADFIVQKKLV